jgi:hypothetical protein
MFKLQIDRHWQATGVCFSKPNGFGIFFGFHTRPIALGSSCEREINAGGGGFNIEKLKQAFI